MLFIAACSAIAFAQVNEATLSRSTSYTTEGGKDKLVLGTENNPPDEVRQDLEKLSEKIDSLDIAFYRNDGALIVSRDGKRILHQTNSDTSRIQVRHDSDDPTGVTVWPDWRDATNTLFFPEASRGQWLSPHHVLLGHWTPSVSLSAIVDIRNPAFAFDINGSIQDCRWSPQNVAINSMGQIIGATKGCGLWIGNLNQDEEVIEGHFVEMPASVCDVHSIDDRWHILQTNEGQDSRIFIFDSDNELITTEITGYLSGMCGQFHTDGNRLGRRSFYFESPEGRKIGSVDESGHLQLQEWDSTLSVMMPSPSGTVVYARNTTQYPLRSTIANTPVAPPNSSTPIFPTEPKGPLGIHKHMDLIGWLTWE